MTSIEATIVAAPKATISNMRMMKASLLYRETSPTLSATSSA
jgi:hypothetical protein